MCIQLVTKSERRIFQVTLKYSNLYISSEIYTKGEKNPPYLFTALILLHVYCMIKQMSSYVI